MCSGYRELQGKRAEKEGAGRTGRGMQDGSAGTAGEGRRPSQKTMWACGKAHWHGQKTRVKDVPPGPLCSPPPCRGSTRAACGALRGPKIARCLEQILPHSTAVTAACGGGSRCPRAGHGAHAPLCRDASRSPSAHQLGCCWSELPDCFPFDTVCSGLRTIKFYLSFISRCAVFQQLGRRADIS